MAEKRPPNPWERLKGVLKTHSSLAIALSGGVDSSFLLYAACAILGPQRVLALTARSAIFAPEDTALAVETAWRLGVRVKVVDMDHLRWDEFVANPPERCYYCKYRMYQRLLARAKELGFSGLADGTQADDLKQDRPGLKALKELGVFTPLAQARLDKTTVRALARKAGLRQAQRPAAPCLATRFAPGHPIASTPLKQILHGERLLRALGLENFRLRFQKAGALIEISPKEEKLLHQQKDFLLKGLKELGFKELCLKIR